MHIAACPRWHSSRLRCLAGCTVFSAVLSAAPPWPGSPLLVSAGDTAASVQDRSTIHDHTAMQAGPGAPNDPTVPGEPVEPSAAGDSAGFIDFGDGPLPLDRFSPPSRSPRSQAELARPTFAVLTAQLASWDADAEPDGWRCRIQLRDQFDAPCRPDSATASFELRLRVPRRDLSGFRDLRTEAIRWSEPLQLDARGIAEVKLPLRAPLPSFYLDGEGAARWGSSSNAGSWRPLLPADRFRDPRLTASEGYVISTVSARPSYGVIVVRVSVPSVGVLQAIDAVLVDEPLLVDSDWPQR